MSVSTPPTKITVHSQLGNDWIFEARSDRPQLSDALVSESTGYQLLLFKEFEKYYDFRGKRVLEIGSDSRLNTARMFIEGGAAEVHASNIQDILVRTHASERIHLHVGDAGKLDFGDQDFDVIYGIALLEHVPDYGPLCEAISRLLAADGVAYLHGDPLWTGPQGHHVYCVKRDQGRDYKYKFNDPALNPIPDWAHLTMDHWMMADYLESEGILRSESQEIADFVYGIEAQSLGDFSNKKSASEIKALFDPLFDMVAFIGVHEGEANEYFQKAREKYSEADLRAKGMTLWLRNRNAF